MTLVFFKKLNFSCVARVLVYVVISGLVVFNFKQVVVSDPVISLSLQSPKPELIQVFCDIGDGFKEILSSRVIISQSQMKGELFGLTLPGKCKQLRFDFGGVGSCIKVNAVALYASDGQRFDLMNEIMFPISLHEVNQDASTRQIFTSLSDDPYIVLSGNFSGITGSNYSLFGILRLMALFLVVFVVISAFDYFMNKID